MRILASKKNHFEEKLNQLTSLSDQLESGNLSLDEMLEAFEKGVKLYKECHQVLTDAEAKINLIMIDDDKAKEIPFVEKGEE